MCSSGFDLDAIVQGVEQKPDTAPIENPVSQRPMEGEIKSEQEYGRLEIAEEDRMIGSVTWKLYWLECTVFWLQLLLLFLDQKQWPLH